jgi:hypothetical protein
MLVATKTSTVAAEETPRLHEKCGDAPRIPVLQEEPCSMERGATRRPALPYPEHEFCASHDREVVYCRRRYRILGPSRLKILWRTGLLGDIIPATEENGDELSVRMLGSQGVLENRRQLCSGKRFWKEFW